MGEKVPNERFCFCSAAAAAYFVNELLGSNKFLYEITEKWIVASMCFADELGLPLSQGAKNYDEEELDKEIKRKIDKAIKLLR